MEPDFFKSLPVSPVNGVLPPNALAALKANGVLPENVELRQVKYLNNLIEQDHRFIKRLVKPGMGFFSFETAWRTLQGYEMMNMIRKGQLQGVRKGDVGLFLHRAGLEGRACSDYEHDGKPADRGGKRLRCFLSQERWSAFVTWSRSDPDGKKRADRETKLVGSWMSLKPEEV
jgi:DDE domain